MPWSEAEKKSLLETAASNLLQSQKASSFSWGREVPKPKTLNPGFHNQASTQHGFFRTATTKEKGPKNLKTPKSPKISASFFPPLKGAGAGEAAAAH